MIPGWTLGETILAAGTVSLAVPYSILFAVVLWRRHAQSAASVTARRHDAPLIPADAPSHASRPTPKRAVRPAPVGVGA